jgi:hypothetical protein
LISAKRLLKSAHEEILKLTGENNTNEKSNIYRIHSDCILEKDTEIQLLKIEISALE